MRSQRSTKSVVVILAAGLLATWPAASTASVTLSLNNFGSTSLHEITAARGGTFDVDVNLDTDVRAFLVECYVSLRVPSSHLSGDLRFGSLHNQL